MTLLISKLRRTKELISAFLLNVAYFANENDKVVYDDGNTVIQYALPESNLQRFQPE